MAKIMFFTGLALLVNGLILSFIVNFNIGTVLVLLLGLFFTLWGYFYNKIKNNKFTKIIKYIVIFMLVAEASLVSFIAIYGQKDNISYNEDAVIVLGAGIRGDEVTLPLKMRLDKAVEYHLKNPDALIVVSGGQGFQETVTEAYAMEKYLIENGVDKDKIIKEEEATSTNENMRFSKEILDKKFNDEYEVVIITNGFHIYRGVTIAKIEGFENVSHIHAGLQWYNLPTCYLRESLAVLKMWFLG